MNRRTLGILTVCAMGMVGSAVYAVTPDGGFGRPSKEQASASSDAEDAPGGDVDLSGPSVAKTKGSEFSAGTSVRLDGRLGHERLTSSSARETFVMLEVQGAEDGQVAIPPRVRLSIVIDKSGSMQGTRLQNAIAAAETAISRLNDGDSVSVIAFDTKPEVVVAQTVVDPSSRTSAIRAVRTVRLGGDTCISCGLEEGMKQLRSSGNFDASPEVRRMLLLSDGDATAGVRDLPGFRRIAETAMRSSVNITTVGVDVDFNEAIMKEIALGSNGRHYFVENDRDLVKVFDAEAAALSKSVAAEVEAELELGSGVELAQLFDRQFVRTGSKITVPLGSFSKSERKTVLARVTLPRLEGDNVQVASVRIRYRDLATGRIVEETGKLSVAVASGSEAASPLDGIVLDRLQRSETTAALSDANSLFSLGKSEEAVKRLEEAKNKLAANRRDASLNAPKPRAAAVGKSFDEQEGQLDDAQSGFRAPPPATPAQPAPDPSTEQRRKKSTVRESNERQINNML